MSPEASTPDLTGRLWLNAADTPSDYLALPMLWGSGMTWPLDAANRRYAGGALRVTAALAAVPTWKPALGRLTSAQALSLAARAGRVHLARDPIGQRVACVWTSVDITWLGPVAGSAVSAAVTLTLERTDYDESV